MPVSPAQMAVIRRWFAAPTHVPDQAMILAIEALLTTALAAYNETPSVTALQAENGDFLLTEAGDQLLVD